MFFDFVVDAEAYIKSLVHIDASLLNASSAAHSLHGSDKTAWLITLQMS